MTDLDALLLAVLERPHDDTPRLVYADALDDAGEHARAEFIRVQVELSRWHTAPGSGSEDYRYYVDLRRRERELLEAWNRTWFYPIREQVIGYDVTRGFVAELRLSLRTFAGGVCEQCGGNRGRWKEKHGHDFWIKCYPCNGTGRAPGLDPAAVFGRHPITTVRIVDREPMRNSIDEGAMWFWTWASDLGDSPSSLPREILDHDLQRVGITKSFPTRDAALDALSAACVALGRQAAGLPQLPPTGEGREPHPQQVPQGG